MRVYTSQTQIILVLLNCVWRVFGLKENTILLTYLVLLTLQFDESLDLTSEWLLFNAEHLSTWAEQVNHYTTDTVP
jgi:hypothetical protein